MRKYITIITASLCLILTSCVTNTKSNKPIITVSLPVQEYFVKAIADTLVDVNVMIPVTAGHSTYTPLPSQLRALSESATYLAIGSLDFEIAWKERLMNTVDKDKFIWQDLDLNIEPCYTTHCHNHAEECGEEEHDMGEEEESTHLTKDPHYWTSPKQAKHMLNILSASIKAYCGKSFNEQSLNNRTDLSPIPDYEEIFVQKVRAIYDTLSYFDEQLKQSSAKAFMIYHPALTYLARDYGMTQLTIEQEGKSISPREYAEQIEKAREMGVKVVFCQQGYDTERVRSAANDLGATIVEIQPESSDYIGQMNKIIDALK